MKHSLQKLAIPKSQFRSTLDNGRITGTSVLCLKGTALTEIRTATSWV